MLIAKRPTSCLVLTLCAAVIAAGPAQAQEDTPPRGRDLGGHLYLVSPLVPVPFMTTNFDARTTVGRASADGPDLDIHGNRIGTRSYRLVAEIESFNLQISPLDWLAVRGGGIAYVYSGDRKSTRLNSSHLGISYA